MRWMAFQEYRQLFTMVRSAARDVDRSRAPRRLHSRNLSHLVRPHTERREAMEIEIQLRLGDQNPAHRTGYGFRTARFSLQIR